MKLEFSWQNFDRYSNIKFYESLPMGAKLLHTDEQPDRHDEFSSLFGQFCERV